MSFIRKQLYFFIKKLSEIDHKRFYRKKINFISTDTMSANKRNQTKSFEKK